MPEKDYSGTPLYRKLGIKEGARVVLIGAPPGGRALLEPLPPGATVATRVTKETDVALFFATEEKDLVARFEKLAATLVPNGGLWVAYPKKSSSIPTDLTFQSVQDIGLEAGLVDNKSCAVDDDWSGVRFVYRLQDR
jgi:bifunctional DNA-binding transcriptional regulator/antitoxin component of YhaV-PrlF toxin-antitoxin module